LSVLSAEFYEATDRIGVMFRSYPFQMKINTGLKCLRCVDDIVIDIIIIIIIVEVRVCVYVLFMRFLCAISNLDLIV